jgi:hypothetical protein
MGYAGVNKNFLSILTCLLLKTSSIELYFNFVLRALVANYYKDISRLKWLLSLTEKKHVR